MQVWPSCKFLLSQLIQGYASLDISSQLILGQGYPNLRNLDRDIQPEGY